MDNYNKNLTPTRTRLKKQDRFKTPPRTRKQERKLAKILKNLGTFAPTKKCKTRKPEEYKTHTIPKYKSCKLKTSKKESKKWRMLLEIGSSNQKNVSMNYKN